MDNVKMVQCLEGTREKKYIKEKSYIVLKTKYTHTHIYTHNLLIVNGM